jgi:hypothetical protein
LVVWFEGSEAGSVGVVALGDASWPSLLKLLEIAQKVVGLLQFQWAQADPVCRCGGS